MRQTHALYNIIWGTKSQGTQHSPELVLKSTDFRAPEDLIFPALKLCKNTKRDFLLFVLRHRKDYIPRNFLWQIKAHTN